MNEKLLGHLALGVFFLLNGLWHLFNHIKLHSLNPISYTFLPWFPTPISRHLELHLTMAFSSIAVLKNLVLRPRGHQAPLLLSDGTVPSNRLIDLEHSSLSLSLFAYATLATLLDLSRAPHPKARRGLTLLLSALTYLQASTDAITPLCASFRN